MPARQYYGAGYVAFHVGLPVDYAFEMALLRRRSALFARLPGDVYRLLMARYIIPLYHLDVLKKHGLVW